MGGERGTKGTLVILFKEIRIDIIFLAFFFWLLKPRKVFFD